MAQMYKCRPSEILKIEDEYTAYCLDEACAVIQSKLANGETLQIKQQYSSFSKLYDGLEKGGVVCR